MFRLEDIKEAHSKVKSGADFAAYIQDLKKLGVRKYDTYVGDGHSSFFGDSGYRVDSEARYPELRVAAHSDNEKFSYYLKIHQQGKTDYSAFCNHSAETGVEKWTVDIAAMTCTYYDSENQMMLQEKIPTPTTS